VFVKSLPEDSWGPSSDIVKEVYVYLRGNSQHCHRSVLVIKIISCNYLVLCRIFHLAINELCNWDLALRELTISSCHIDIVMLEGNFIWYWLNSFWKLNWIIVLSLFWISLWISVWVQIIASWKSLLKLSWGCESLDYYHDQFSSWAVRFDSSILLRFIFWNCIVVELCGYVGVWSTGCVTK
jgi:hypothetical protein